MALPASGAISLSDFNTELGNAAGTEISLNSTDVRALIGTADGATASFSDYYGASSSVDIALTIAADTNNYNIFSNKGGTYVAGKSNVTLTINSGVSVGSTSTGTYSLDTGTGWASGDTITIVNNGSVRAAGGNGGNGGYASYPNSFAGTNGASGGNALRAQFATTITNNGTFAGGGGGGGGGGSLCSSSAKTGTTTFGGGGGGGGAGINAGTGGTGGTATGATANWPGEDGSNGTATAGGAGGAGVTPTSMLGGAGGGPGAAGSDGLKLATGGVSNGANGTGGAAGNYAVGNSNITWSTTGTRLGGVS